MLHSWEIDPGLIRRAGRWHNEDPMVIPTAATEQYRPGVATRIPNLMLCGDYLNGVWEIANMEAANYNARRAANAILQRTGSREQPAATIGPYRPPEFDALKRIDADRWRRGQPNMFDADLRLEQVKSLLTGSVG